MTDTRRLRVSATASAWWATCRSPRWWTSARSTTSRPRRPATPVYPAPPRTLRGRRRRRDLLALLGSANLASRRWVVRAVRLASCSRAPCGAPRRPTPPCSRCPMAATARSRSPSTATAGAWPAIPYRGAVEAVLECAANLACVGAEPLGLTNCLNFGNPEKPHIAWQLTRAVEGLARRLPGARRAGGGRQRLALQRGRRGPDLPDAGGRHGGRAARSRERRRGLAFARRATRSRCSGRPLRRWPGRSWPSCAASRWRTGCPPSTSAWCGRARRRAPGACAAAR